MKLREDYKSVAGDGYSLKDFHDRFLSFGAPPIPHRGDTRRCLIREAMLGELAGPSL